MSAAIVATVAVGAYSAHQSNKNSKRASRAAEQATSASLGMYDKNIKRADTLVNDQKLVASNEIADLKKDLDYFNNLAQQALDSGDQAAYETYKEQLDLINKYEKDLAGSYQSTYGDIETIIGEGRAQEMGLLNTRDADRQGYMDNLKRTASESMQSADILEHERGKALAEGSRPSELDDVHSEIEQDFRDAGAELEKREASYGRDGSRGQLALAIQEAKAKADASGDLRMGHKNDRLNRILSLTAGQNSSMNNANQSEGEAVATGERGDYLKQDALNRYMNMRIGNKENLGANKSAILADSALKRLGVTTGYHTSKNQGKQAYLQMLAGNRAGFRSGQLGVNNTLLNTKLAGLDSAVSASNNAADALSGIAQQNLQAAASHAAQRDQAIGQGIAGVVDLAKNYKRPSTIGGPPSAYMQPPRY